MNTFIGIDLGTSSMKLLLVDETGSILSSCSEEYPISYPKPGWSEQSPEDWYSALERGLPRLLRGQDVSAVRAMGFGGQMHGLVALDGSDRVIRPCILWNDGRTEAETEYLNTVIGKKKLSDCTANIAFAGFTAPKILWMKKNEPENFARISKIMLPKDYLVYRLSGIHASDYSDASGTLLLDVQNKRWSEEMCRICSVEKSWLPKLYESYESVGMLRDFPAMPELCGKVKIVVGAGDNAAAAIGSGTVRDGDCNISLGTSGTVFISQDKFSVDKANALHSFCHANGSHHLMGCILSAASCNAWWMNVLKTGDYDGELDGADKHLGKNDVFFLPYLMGERSPHNDVHAKGAFIGIHPYTERCQLSLSVLEGVTFALRDCIEVAKKNGLNIKTTRICGGGAKSRLWRELIANIIGVPVEVPVYEGGPAYGAAILCMAACGIYRDVREASGALVRITETIYPDRFLTDAYNKRYEIFTRLYPALKEVSALF